MPLPTGGLQERFDAGIKRLESAVFTAGVKDKQMVTSLYREYVGKIATVLTATLGQMQAKAVPAAEDLPPMPTITLPEAQQTLPHGATLMSGILLCVSCIRTSACW